MFIATYFIEFAISIEFLIIFTFISIRSSTAANTLSFIIKFSDLTRKYWYLIIPATLLNNAIISGIITILTSHFKKNTLIIVTVASFLVQEFAVIVIMLVMGTISGTN